MSARFGITEFGRVKGISPGLSWVLFTSLRPALRFGLRLLLDLIGGRVHFLVYASVDLLLGIVIENTQLLELQRERHDWVLCRPSLYFFTGAITAVIVVAGMRHQAVGFRL